MSINDILTEIKNDIAGAMFLKDWLGEDGQTVTQDVAESRANVCRTGNDGKKCPHNSHPDWWSRWFKDPIAHAIRRELEIKERIQIKLADEESVNMCGACGCCIRLKVWAPDQHIKDRTTPQSLIKMPPYCWIRKIAA